MSKLNNNGIRLDAVDDFLSLPSRSFDKIEIDFTYNPALSFSINTILNAGTQGSAGSFMWLYTTSGGTMTLQWGRQSGTPGYIAQSIPEYQLKPMERIKVCLEKIGSNNINVYINSFLTKTITEPLLYRDIVSVPIYLGTYQTAQHKSNNTIHSVSIWNSGVKEDFYFNNGIPASVTSSGNPQILKAPLARRINISNKVPKKNLLLKSDLKIADSSVKSNVTDASGIANFTNGIYFGNNSTTRYFYTIPKYEIGKQYTFSFYVKMADNSIPVPGLNLAGKDFSVVMNGSAYSPSKIEDLGNNVYRISHSIIYNTAGIANTGVIKYPTQTAKDFTISGFQFEEGYKATFFENYLEGNKKAIKPPNKNLLLPFDSGRWDLNSGTINTIKSPYVFEAYYPTTTTNNHFYSIDVTPNTNYVFSMEHNGGIAVFNGDASVAIANYTANQSISFNTGVYNKIRLYFRSNGTVGYHEFKNPQLELGNTSTIFEEYKEVHVLSRRAPKIYKLSDDFVNKVASSTVENPHIAYAIVTGLGLSTNLTSENFGVAYTRVGSLDGSTQANSNTTAGGYAQHRFSFNLIKLIQRKLNFIVPGITVAQQVQWLKNNISKITANWHGFGSSPTGNKASLKLFNPNTNDWNYYGVQNTTQAIITKLTMAQTTLLTNAIDSNGFVHYLAYAEPSDGVTASTINTDYVNIELETKPIIIF